MFLRDNGHQDKAPRLFDHPTCTISLTSYAAPQNQRYADSVCGWVIRKLAIRLTIEFPGTNFRLLCFRLLIWPAKALSNGT